VILLAKQNYNSALFFQKKGLNFLVSPGLDSCQVPMKERENTVLVFT